MSINGDDRHVGADESSTSPVSESGDAFEDKHTAPVTTTQTSTTDKNSAPPQITPQSPATEYPPVSNNPNNNNNQSSAFMRQQGYYTYQQSNPPLNSPAPTTLGYDKSQALLLQHLGTGALNGRQPYDLSPALQNGTGNNIGSAGVTDDAQISLGVLAPSSPLFPMQSMGFMGTNSEQQHVDSSRMTGGSLIAPPSPSMQFMPHPPSPVVSGYGGVYGGYAAGSPSVGYASPSIGDVGNSPDNRFGPDRVQQPSVYQTAPPSATSPHIQPMQFQTGRRTASFDEMLPGPAIDDNSSYTGSTITAGGTVFSQQQAPWGYNLNNPYTASPQQPQIQSHHLPQPPGAVSHRGLPGQHGRSPQGVVGTAGYYPATTPGPPIQTTHHNKGPDGANLFIFHIPNHFTNLDMWHLFCHYGNLLSVRIMVEKDSGRSRGFGFVSYDSSDAAAMAIKELNGFVIGNKRLKVQHKQIRPSDNNHQASQQDNLQSPPLFPQMNNGHNVPATGDAENENSGNINMISRTWMDEAHNETSEIVQSSRQKTVEGSTRGGQHHQPTSIDEVAVVSEIDSQKSIVQSSNSNTLGRHYDDGTESKLGSLDQMRDALPDITK